MINKLINNQIAVCITARNDLNQSPFITAIDTLVLLFEPEIKQKIQEFKKQHNIEDSKEEYTILFNKLINTQWYGENWE